MNVLLIHQEVRDAQVFVDSVNSNTRAILYDQTHLLAELSGPIEQLGIVFIKGMTFMGKPFEEQVDLLNNMIAQHQIKRIDFLACNTLPEWNDFYAKLNTVVGASSDRTGNLKYGGNWVMESTGQDIEAVYFTKSIEYYQYLLDWQGDAGFALIREDGRLWMKGHNTTGPLGGSDLYIKKLGLINVPFNASSKIVGGAYTTYVLTNGILYGTGSNLRKALTSHASIVEKENTYYSGNKELDEFTVIPLPNTSPGVITDVAGGANCCILIDGKTYFTGDLRSPSFSNFTRVEIFDSSANSILATKIWGYDGRYFALAEDKLYVIGDYGYGPFMPSTISTNWVNIPFPVDASGTLTHAGAGDGFFLVIIGGTLYGIGKNSSGQLGSMPKTDISTFRKATYNDGVTATAPATNVTHLSTFMNESLVVMNNKLYRVWDGTLTEISVVAGTINSIARGDDHALVVIDGVLYGYGAVNNSQLGMDVIPIKASGMYNSANINSPVKIIDRGVDVSGITQVYAADTASFIIKGNQLYGMGNNKAGRLGIKRKLYSSVLEPLQNKSGVILENVTKVAYSGESTLIVSNGSLYVTGRNAKSWLGMPSFDTYYDIEYLDDIYQPTLPVEASGSITHLSHGYTCGAVVVKGGVVYNTGAFGGYPYGKFHPLTVPTGTIEEISSGYDFVVFRIGGKLYSMGNNQNNRGGGSTTAYRSNVTSFDNANFTTSGVTLVACGPDFTVFVMKDPVTNQDRLYRTANAPYGPTGNNEYAISQINFPSGIPVDTSIDAISAGDKFMCVIFNKKLYGLGYNQDRQITSVADNDPGWVHMSYLGTPITNATSIQCQSRLTSAVLGGKLYARGSNYFFNIAPTTATPLDWTYITEGLAGGSVSIESISRMTGTTNTQITITGTLFGTITSVVLDTDATTTVSANAVTCAIVAGRTATSLTFTIPAGNGTKRIKLVTADKNYVVTGDFAYRNPIQITSLSSYTGTKNKIINIIATDMTNLKRVIFNEVGTTAFSRISATEYTVVVPDSTTGTVVLEDVFNVVSNQILFRYEKATLINGFISPATSNSSATISGKAGDTLTLVGTFLSDTNAVYFGNTQAALVSKSGDNVVVTVPVELGTVSIRIYDNNNNMTVCAKQFVYQLASVVQGAVQAVVQASTLDASGQKYYSILEGTSYFIVKYVSDTSYNKLYSNALQPIRGIACSGTTLYFCDPSNNRVQSIPTTSTGLTAATPVLTRGTMVPEAIKVKGTKLYIVCTNTGVSTDDAIVIVDGTTTAQPYSAFGAYSLQGIAYNPAVSDTSLYISAVSYTSPNKILTSGTGRIFKTDAAGGSVLPFIEGLTNPIDLTFSNGYLVVDGIINIYSPSGLLVSSLNTPANSIITQVILGQESVSFTSVDGNGTTVNELTMPPYIENVLQLTASYSPNKGPKGTMVTIVGYNMTTEGITSIKIRDASSILIDPITATINANVIVLRMPDKPAAGTEVKIVVTPVTGSPQEYAFSYQSPDLINIIPLFSGDTKYFHFTGNNLQNIQYVDFVDTSTNVLSVNKLPVRNVTATSFNCSFVTVPINTTRCLLLDAFGAVTIEDANYFSLSSETCFLSGTPVLTDQGEVPIDKLDHTYTIDQREIVAITKTRYNKDTLILLEKDSLKKNYPTRDTVITHKHKIYYKGKMKRAESFLKKDGVRMIPYKNQYLYNVLLKTHEVMRVNGLICETLYPKNPIAKFFTAQDLSLDQESIHAESFD